MILKLFVQRTQAEKRKEQHGVDAFHPRPVRHNERGVQTIERAFGNYDGNFGDGFQMPGWFHGRAREGQNWSFFNHVSLLTAFKYSHAAWEYLRCGQLSWLVLWE